MGTIRLCLLAAMVASAAAAGEFNFYPSNVVGEVSLLSGEPVKCASGDCSFPAPWHKDAQTAYPELGNANAKGVLKIAVSDYFPQGPTLYVVPGAWCDTAGAGVGANPDGVVPKGSAATPAAAAAKVKPHKAKPSASKPAAKPTASASAAGAKPAAAPAGGAAAAGPATAAPLPRRLLQAEPAAAGGEDGAAVPVDGTDAAAAPAAPEDGTTGAAAATDDGTVPDDAAAAADDATAADAAADDAAADGTATDGASADGTTDAASADDAAAAGDAATTDGSAAADGAAKPESGAADAAGADGAAKPEPGAADAAAPEEAASKDAAVAAPAADAPAAAEPATKLESGAAQPEAAAPGAAAPEVAAPEAAAPAEEPSVYTVETDGACVRSGPVSFTVGDDANAQTAEEVQLESGATAYKIALPNNLPNGGLCITISAPYDTSAVKTVPSYTDAFEPLGASTTFSKKVCLYKLTKQADAVLNFDMCTNNKFMVNITDIAPLPVNVTLDAQPTDANLFTPLIKLYGGKVAELDGTPTEPRNYDEVASRTEYNWIAKYFPVSPAYVGEPLSYTLSDTLQEGYYEVSTVVSVLTKYPKLTSLAGLTQITQVDASGEGVKGLWEAASHQVHTKALVGVQKGSTPTTLSKIWSSSHAPGQAVMPGQDVALTWQFRGVGSATCTHDGQVVSNAEAGKCVSPLSVQARDVSGTDTKHSVVVTFTDVCGGVRTAEFEYTQSGVRPLTQAEVLHADGSIEKVLDGGMGSNGGAGGGNGGNGAGGGYGGYGGSIVGKDGVVINPEAGEVSAAAAGSAAGNATAKSGAFGRAAGATALAGAAAVAAALLL